MALKAAKMFKDFYITPNVDNTAVTLSMRDAVDIKVKNDNFASQVTVLDKNDEYDFFSYKYITFDGTAVFEITDVIKNGNYATLFIEYTANVTFDTLDAGYYVESVSARTLSRLGMDINEFLRVLGKNGGTELDEIITDKRNDNFFYAVKIRLSECPQNLSKMIVPTGTGAETSLVDGGVTGKDLADANFSANIPNITDEMPKINGFSQFDSAFTVFLYIPRYKWTSFYFERVQTGEQGGGHYQFGIKHFLTALNKLITDLTLSVELTIMSTNSLVSFRHGDVPFSLFSVTPPDETQALATAHMIVPFDKNDDGTSAPNAQVFGGMIRAFEDETRVNYPIFCAGIYTAQTISGTGTNASGIAEIFRPEKLYLPNDDDKIYTSIILLGNEISLRDCRDDFIVIKRRNNSLRVYQSFAQNVYIDIVTTFEFARDAYSNYDAYKKANIDLVQAQQNATLEQTQRQERDLQTVNTSFMAANGALSAATSGSIFGAIKSAANTALQIAQSEITFNMRQANDRANQKLSQQQEHEKARETITPASEQSGSIEFNDAFFTDVDEAKTRFTQIPLFVARYIPRTPALMKNLERYIFENEIMDRITDVEQITRPQWQTLHNYFMAKIQKTDPRNTRKAFIVYAYGGAWEQKGGAALFIDGDEGAPNIDAGTGFVGNLSNNGGAGVKWEFYAADDATAHITAYVTLRRYESTNFRTIWQAKYGREDMLILITENPLLQKGEYATEWTKSYPVDLGNIDIKKGYNFIEITVNTPAVKDMNGNIDKIQIDTDTGITFIKHDNK